MTHIDFYILAGEQTHGRERLACRLAEKIYKLGHRLYIHTGDAAHSRLLDELLWTFRPGSFIPHELRDDSESPVRIGHDPEQAAAGEVLINLAPQVPLFFSQYERVAEIIDQSPAHKDSGRERYRFYRDRGYTLKTHNIGT
ncbi:MAG: DNA polymerase III subunit chi [Gammaproteobacteria bacterium]